ncbi:DHA2 family efflux MFS transporter permease subunit [Gulosibacter chungangensis]|uniref:DHA2 family efflux MFS transporter permease subunit n=1 Tax=Gulosibacter chungangensis TaxID=979746 RepID=A0A7J5BIN3_9MICO|nr:DHA2 family efflux MFS transporter permease subunit [Gulosibacter chungangensis]KAB1645299.1 DHA2 family efflux MFS transporter permease subunit [Gulosibacter chungangensis]
MVLGFFMILVDTTIVSVANPTIMAELETSMTATLWATSAFLLAYAVPLLITGRLGDRFGPRRLYVSGLVTFTLASLLCGLSPNIEVLIAARVVQGLGASMMTPQTMAVITRIFEPEERGSAMAVWGVTAGVATLFGPILGGFLLDGLGWEWIFFINVPVGIIAIILAMRYIPKLSTSPHRFDWLGVALSAVGMFLVVFAIQEGETFNWGTIWGPITVWLLIVVGAVFLVLFVIWQHFQRGEPLIPLRIFKDRNFSVGTVAIITVGFSMTSQSLPLMFYLQLVQGLTPTQSALMMAPMAILSIALARPVGKLIDSSDPRRLPIIGLATVAGSLLLYSFMAVPEISIWWLLLPSAVSGFGQAFMWGPLATLTTFSLERSLAGAGSGVYNTSRQVGAVLGSSAMAALMATRLSAQFGESAADIDRYSSGAAEQLPEALQAGFAAAMGQSFLMPAIALGVGAIVAFLFMRRATTP